MIVNIILIKTKMCTLFKQLYNRTVWKTLFLSQFLSLLICTTRITSQYIQNYYKIHIPSAQSFLTYCLLCIIFTTWLAFRPTNKGLLHVIRMRGWKYLLLSVVDVGANYVLIKAFQYTALTSIQLLDCIQLPTVLALSWLFIKVRFGLLHILGSCIALMGVGCLVWADIEDISTDITPKNRFLGDMLCLLGAALYAISNVSEEYAVKCYSIVEFLGMIGLFGTILNGIQLYFLERHELVNAINFEKWQEISLVIGFSMSLLLVYITMPLVLQLSNASALNISILSSDFYSLMFGIYLFRFKFHWLYFVSFASVIIGFLVYFLEPTQTHPTPDNNFNETNINGEYNNDIDINRVITTNAYITTSPAYNQFNSQFNIISVSDLQNTYLTSANVHSCDELSAKPIN